MAAVIHCYQKMAALYQAVICKTNYGVYDTTKPNQCHYWPGRLARESAAFVGLYAA